VDAPGRPIAKVFADLPFTVSNYKDKVRNSCITGGKDKVLHHRPVGKWEHYFRALRRERTHPLSLTRGENDTFHTYSYSYNI
jgi:hypothetical protein